MSGSYKGDVNMEEQWWSGLTPKRRKFCEVYSSNDGNALEAAKSAGYRSPHPEGQRLLQKATIVSALERLREATTNSAIACRMERQSMWTAVMRDEENDLRDRLRASELLGKSQADFIERRQVESDGKIQIEIVRTIIEGEAR